MKELKRRIAWVLVLSMLLPMLGKGRIEEIFGANVRGIVGQNTLNGAQVESATVETEKIEGETETPDVWDGTTDTNWYAEGETEFEIYTAEQLAGIAELANKGELSGNTNFYLMQDIYLNENWEEYEVWGKEAPENEWTPIANTEDFPLLGNFHGNGHTIYGMYIDEQEDCIGLFGNVGDILLEDMHIRNSYIKGKDYVGALAGECHGILKKCSSNAIVSGQNYVGGLCGYFGTEGIVNGCYVVGDVSGETYVGGVAGKLQYLKQEDLQLSGYVMAKIDGGNCVGTLAGAIEFSGTGIDTTSIDRYTQTNDFFYYSDEEVNVEMSCFGSNENNVPTVRYDHDYEKEAFEDGRIALMLKRFGFGQKIGIDPYPVLQYQTEATEICEVVFLIYKENNYKENNYLGNECIYVNEGTYIQPYIPKLMSENEEVLEWYIDSPEYPFDFENTPIEGNPVVYIRIGDKSSTIEPSETANVEPDEDTFVDIATSTPAPTPTLTPIPTITPDADVVEGVKEDWLYTIANAEVTIHGYLGKETKLRIPDTLAGYPVTIIGDRCFSDNDQITNITFPRYLKKIGKSSFSSCDNITGDLVLPEGLEEIGSSAFEGCGITGELVLPSTLKSIGIRAFVCCESLTGDVVIPAGMTKIEMGVFSECRKLENVTFHDNVEEIGEGAFEACVMLTQLELPENLKRIEFRAFSACKNIKSDLVLPSQLEYIGQSAFSNCKKLRKVYISDINVEINVFAFESSSVTIYGTTGSVAEQFATRAGLPFIDEALPSPTPLFTPEADAVEGDLEDWYYEVEDTGEVTLRKFLGYTTDLRIPDTMQGYPVTVVGEYCIEVGGDAIQSLTLPRYLREIGEMAFMSCDNITNLNGRIVFPESLTTIGDYAFPGHIFHGELVFPEGLTSIGECAFQVCDYVEKVIIPSANVTIGKNAFYDCDFTIYGIPGSTVESYANYYRIPFADIATLTPTPTATPSPTPSPTRMPENLANPDWDYTITDGKVTIKSYKGTDTEVKVPDTIGGYPVTGIATGAFPANINVNIVHIPVTVVNIAPGAFVKSSVKIYGATGSVAEFYAKGNGYIFVDNTTPTVTRDLTITIKKKKSDVPKISWTKNANATSYEVYRSTKKKKGYKRIKVLSATKTSYIDKKSRRGKTYYYKVRVICEKDGQREEGYFSNIIKAKRQYLITPVIRVKKVGGAQSEIVVKLKKKQGKYVQIYYQKAKEKKKMIKLRSAKLKKLYRFQYRSSAKRLTIWVRTYVKKGKKIQYSRYAKKKL